MKKVLIVEDESLIALEISSFVQALGYKVIGVVSNAKEALELLETQSVSVVLMDVYIEGDLDGIECASMIQKISKTALIYISAFSDDETLQRAILTNPAAYLVKPFNREELKVALLLATKKLKDQLFYGDVKLDDEFSYDSLNKELFCKGELIHLTKREKELLSLLILNKNNIVTFDQIELEVWPNKNSNESTRRALVAKLRAKLKYKFIDTIHSIGYKIMIKNI